MCKKEMQRTLEKNNFSYLNKKTKFFSPYLWYILNRVKDGKFNLSSEFADKYECVLAFKIEDSDIKNFRKKGKYEVLLPVEKVSEITLNGIILLI